MDLTEPLKAAFREWHWTPEAKRSLRDGFMPEPADLAKVAQSVIDQHHLVVVDLRDGKVLDLDQVVPVSS